MPHPTGPLDGHVVVVTGASSGIGEATARRLAAAGAHVVLGARREERLQALTRTIRAGGGSGIHRPTDVRRLEDLEALVGLALTEHGRVDAIVNNAGLGPIGPMDDRRIEDWDAMIDVNLRGTLHGIAAALPHFRSQGFGHVVNVVSTAGLRIVPDQAVYAATKNAVRTLTEGLRQEAGAGLRVTAVSPGFVRTDFADSMTDPAVREAIRARAEQMGIAPDAVAAAIEFVLAQPADVEISELVVRPTAQA